MSQSKTILLTGAAGFIGFHTAKALLERGDKVIGIDNLNNYYDPKLKEARLKLLKKYPNFIFYKSDISEKIPVKEHIDVICHLAAQAGVRYSIENPFAYEKANMLGTLNIFEYARHNNIKSVVYASSSSVYGNTKELPFKETQQLDTPISLYAATKKANELYAHVYHHLFGINMVGLRFFTVYGPFGRPDMALFKFTDNIIKGNPIEVFNNGKMKRDFTYVADIVQGVIASIDKLIEVNNQNKVSNNKNQISKQVSNQLVKSTKSKNSNQLPPHLVISKDTNKDNINNNNIKYFEIFNLARGECVELNDFITEIEKNLKKKSKKVMLPMQQGDVPETSAATTKAKQMLGYEPKISIRDGVKSFVNWYKEYYNASQEN